MAASALVAMLAVIVWEKLSDQPATKRATSRMWAHLFAIRLFSEEPRIVFESLLGVVTANARLLLLAVPPMVILVPVLFLVYGYLDRSYGSAPIAVGVPRVLTVRLSEMEDVSVEAPEGVEVALPPVHVLAAKEISWRIQPTKAIEGAFKIRADGETIEVKSQRWPGYLALRPRGPIEEVNLSEPAAPISCYGISLKWEWWFTMLSLVFVLPARLIAKRIFPMLSSTVSWSVRHSTSGDRGGS